MGRQSKSFSALQEAHHSMALGAIHAPWNNLWIEALRESLEKPWCSDRGLVSMRRGTCSSFSPIMAPICLRETCCLSALSVLNGHCADRSETIAPRPAGVVWGGDR